MRMLAVLVLAFSSPATAGALEDYIKRPDPAYGWSLYAESGGLLAEYFFLRLQSQQWLDAKRVDRTLWEHQIRISQPRPELCGDTARTSNLAILIVSGGSNSANGEFGTSVPLHAGFIGYGFCRPVIEIRQVPNQPLRFADEYKPRKEDQIIAYSFDRFLNGEPGDWPVQLAMVRAVVQAMTAIQEFSRTRDDMPDIDRFVLIGASKRGWTAWLTAATDPRVFAVVPVSIDMPSMAEQFPHHYASYGRYSTALDDYQAFDIGCRMAGERGRALLGIVDPIAYTDRLNMPKMILNSAGDEFFVSDSWRFYYDRLPGAKRLRYTANTDHDQGDGFEHITLFMQVRNWVDDLVAGREPPGLSWERAADGTLMVQATQPPREVRVWSAENPRQRDFRLEKIGPGWTPRPLAPDADGRYRVRLEAPAKGWRAYVVEAEFGGFYAYDRQVYTTGVYVVPETLPHGAEVCAEAKAAAVSAPPRASPPSRR
jgi:PhoPQ-activated pathogenicity-related protein